MPIFLWPFSKFHSCDLRAFFWPPTRSLCWKSLGRSWSTNDISVAGHTNVASCKALASNLITCLYTNVRCSFGVFVLKGTVYGCQIFKLFLTWDQPKAHGFREVYLKQIAWYGWVFVQSIISVVPSEYKNESKFIF